MKLLIVLISFLSIILFKSSFNAGSTKFNYDDGYIIFEEIDLNNKRISGNFLFDSGAQLTVIDISLLDSFKYKDNGFITSVDFHGNKKIVRKIYVNSIKIGDINFYGVDAYVMDLSKYQCYDFKGIIGFNLIKRANWNIDFLNKKITTTSIGQSINIVNANSIPFKIKDQSIHANVKIENKTFETILDTGAKNEINLTLKDFEKLTNKKYLKDSLYSVDLYTSTLNDSAFSNITVFFTKINNLFIGNKNYVKKVNFLGARTIGIDFFRHSDFLIIDFNQKKIFFKDKYSSDLIITKHGINFTKLENGQIIVSYLRKKSPLTKQGVKIGDKVLSVNNATCELISICDCKNLLSEEIKKDSIKINFELYGELFSY